jgi:cytoskeletal protein CcmA (bactofilin family)
MLGRTKTQTVYREPQPAYREPQPAYREAQVAYREPLTPETATIEPTLEAPEAPVFTVPEPVAYTPPVPKGPPPLFKVLGGDAKLDGRFEVAESIDIECELSGELIVGGRLLIGTNGVVNATAHTVDAVIEGSYEGSMVATGTVEILPTGRVSGSIETDSLVIAKGAVFDGNVVKRVPDPTNGIARSHR